MYPDPLRAAISTCQRIIVVGTRTSYLPHLCSPGTLSVTAHLKSLSAIWSRYWMQGISAFTCGGCSFLQLGY